MYSILALISVVYQQKSGGISLTKIHKISIEARGGWLVGEGVTQGVIGNMYYSVCS